MMAGITSDRAHRKLQQLHDELTECPVCLVEFSMPKQLPCMHTFCVECLRRMTARRGPGDRIPCPMCTQPFTIPHDGVDALPKNFVIDRLVELLRTASIQCDPDQEYEPHPDCKYIKPLPSRPPDYFEPHSRTSATTESVTSCTTVVTPSENAASETDCQQRRGGAMRLFKDPVVFRSVDQHVCDVTSFEHSTVRQLIWNLVFARDITNELEKARVLFRWLCTVDSSTLRFDPELSAQRGAPEEVLTRFKARRATYSEVFRKLCEFVDLRCETISGRVKGAIGRPAVAPGASSTPSSPFKYGRHSWNAIELKGSWYLVDCTWAASSYEKAAKKAHTQPDGDDKGVAGGSSPKPPPTGTSLGTKTTADRRKEWQHSDSKKNVAAIDEPMTSAQDGGGFNVVASGHTPTESRQQAPLSATADYYFMTDPAQMIFTHFPDEACWQLLERPVGVAEFDQLVGVGAAFYTLGLRLIGLQSSRATVRTDLSEVVLRIGCPENRLIMFTVNLSLIEEDGSLVSTLDCVQLNRYVMHETVDNIAHFRVRLPHPKTYRLTLYACDVTETKRIGKLTFEGVCDYCLIRECDNVVTAGAVRPYPGSKMTAWGACLGPDGHRLRPLLKGSTFHCNRDGVAELRFRFSDDLNREMMKFTARLKESAVEGGHAGQKLHPDGVEPYVEGCVLSRVVGTDCDIAAFTVRVPRAGEYSLEIYTVMSDDNDDGEEDDGREVYRLHGQYLIVCKEPPSTSATLPRYPKLSPGFLGPQPMFHKLGLSIISHVDPYVQLLSTHNHAAGDSVRHATSAELRIVIGTTVNLTSRLLRVEDDRTFHFDDYVLQQRLAPKTGHQAQSSLSDEDERLVRIEFVVRVPKPGVYRLQIYAVIGSTNDEDDDLNGSAGTAGSTSDSLSPVYNYVIDGRVPMADASSCVTNVTAKSDKARDVEDVAIPFPRQTNLWRTDGCILHAPLDGRLVMQPRRPTLSNSASIVARSTSTASGEDTSRKRTVVFRLEVPQRVDKVAVVVSGGQWSYLERRPSTGVPSAINSQQQQQQLYQWQGQVQMPVGGSESSDRQVRQGLSTTSVEVCAHYARDSASYRTLLEYTCVL